MTIWQRIAREPNAILGLLVGVYGLLVAFDVFILSAQQVGAVTAFGGALVILLRWLVTPSSEVVVQKPLGEEPPVAANASSLPNGTPVQVTRILGKAFTGGTFSADERDPHRP